MSRGLHKAGDQVVRWCGDPVSVGLGRVFLLRLAGRSGFCVCLGVQGFSGLQSVEVAEVVMRCTC